jgi:hypothetical protein
MTDSLQTNLIAFVQDHGNDPQAWIARGFALGLELAQRYADLRKSEPLMEDEPRELIRSGCAAATKRCAWVYREAVEAGYRVGRMNLNFERELNNND